MDIGLFPSVLLDLIQSLIDAFTNDKSIHRQLPGSQLISKETKADNPMTVSKINPETGTSDWCTKERQTTAKKWVREERCREILELLYNKSFPTVRIVKSPITKRMLEFDGYNAELKLAFEHNGIQHYDYPNVWHKTPKEFLRLVKNDRIKKEACKKMGIALIVIRYDEDIEESIKRQIGLDV